MTKELATEIVRFYQRNHSKKRTLEKFKLTGEQFKEVREIFGAPVRDKRLENIRKQGRAPGRITTALEQISKLYTEEEILTIAKGGNISKHKFNIFKLNTKGERFKFGFISDSHLGASCATPELVSQALELFNKEECECLFHAGDIHEGMSGREGQIYDLTHLGYNKQINHSVEIFSNYKKPMYFIAGNHDLWFMKSNGANIVENMCQRIENAHFLGNHKANFELGDYGVKIQLFHGEDGSSYASSYRLQKLAESYTGGEKPALVLAGHTHKSLYMFDRHIHMISGGALCRQSSWMQNKKLPNHSGFWIVELLIGEQGIIRCTPTWNPLYI